jgi:hypothetical protein
MYVLPWGYELLLPFLLGGLILVAWWASRLVFGAPFHPIGLAITTIVYLLLFVLLETNDWFGFVGYAATAVVILLLAIAALWVHSARTTRVLVGPHGELGFRGSALVAGVWYLVLLVELFAQLTILGYLQFGNFAIVNGFPGLPLVAPGTLPNSYAFVLLVTDGLFALSTGATVGQNLGIYTTMARYRLRVRSARSSARQPRPL